MTNIDALAATLGLETKVSEWSKGESVIEAIEARLKGMAQKAALAQVDFDALGKKVGIAVSPPRAPSVTEEATKVAGNRLRGMQVEAKLASTEVNKALATIGLPGSPGLPVGKTPASNVEAQGVAVSSTLKRLALGLGALFAVQGITQTTKATLDFASNISNLNERTGISITTLQELDRAAKENSTSLESLVGAAQGLSSSLEEAEKSGTGSFLRGLREIGVTTKQLRKTLKEDGLDSALQLIADKVSGLEAGAKKAKIVSHLGIDPALIPALNSLAQARDDAHNLGLIISDEDIANLKKLGDDTERAEAAFAGFKDKALAKLAPELEKIVDGMIAWLQKNQELIESAFVGVVKLAAAALQDLVTVAALLAEGFAFLQKHSDLVMAAIIGYAGALLFASIQAWATTIAAGAAAAGMTTLGFAARAAGTAIKGAMISTGIGIFIAAVALLIEHWDSVKFAAEAVGELISDLFTKMLPEALEWFVNLPVVKQVIWFFNKIGDFLDRSSGAGDLAHDSQAVRKFVETMAPNEAQIGDDVPASPAGTTGGPVGGGGGGASVQIDQLTVVSNEADPKKVADAIKPSLQDLMDEQIRKAKK